MWERGSKMTGLNKGITDLELILTKLVDEFEYGYAFTKNTRELLELLTKYKENNPNDKLIVTLHVQGTDNDISTQ